MKQTLFWSCVLGVIFFLLSLFVLYVWNEVPQPTEVEWWQPVIVR